MRHGPKTIVSTTVGSLLVLSVSQELGHGVDARLDLRQRRLELGSRQQQEQRWLVTDQGAKDLRAWRRGHAS
jgi:hypothetical protein